VARWARPGNTKLKGVSPDICLLSLHLFRIVRHFCLTITSSLYHPTTRCGSSFLVFMSFSSITTDMMNVTKRGWDIGANRV
jgi:hypothetical protein